MYLRFFLIASLLLLSATSHAQEHSSSEAPFGLTWGMTSVEIKSHGIDLREAPFKDYGASFVGSKLPKIIADAETIVLSFGNDDKLWRIVAVSRAYGNDPYGNGVKARYQELVDVLNEKYGRGTPYHQIDSQLWKAPSEFVMGLKAGRTKWFTSYDTASLMIEISIISSGMDEANWRIIFEEKQLRSAFEKSKKNKEKNAL